MRNRKVSLKDIANVAGVSTALVSYVLSGKEKEYRVGPDIAVKIKAIAKDLNYQPNLLAKGLRSGKTHTIGLIVADISNPFFANIARVIEDEAEKNGYTVIIGSSDETAAKSWNLLNVLVNRQVDGFIIVSAEDSEDLVHHLVETNVPFVLLDRHFPLIQTDFVVTDNFKAAYDAGVHLIRSGYEKIGLIAYRSELFHMKERIRGYRQALDNNNLPTESNWLSEVRFDAIEREIRRAIDNMVLAKSPVDALIFATYGLAINGLKYINELQLKVPDDLGIVSFGQAEVFDLYYCPITYVKQPIELLGKTAVDVLVKKLENPTEKLTQISMDATLVERASSKSRILV